MAKITLGGTPAQTIADLPAAGQKAPAFSLIDKEMKKVSMDEFAGRKIVMNIFPSVDTGVCAASVRRFNKEASGLENTVVLCISKDLPFAQARFCGAEGTNNVIMLSNFNDGGAFGRDYGVEITEGAFSGLNARAVIVIYEDETIRYTEVVPEIGQEPNYDNVLEAVR